jgi:outer membrane protein TolC
LKCKADGITLQDIELMRVINKAIYVHSYVAAWNFAPGLALPLFTNVRLKGEVRLNEALMDKALNLYRGSALNAFREVKPALKEAVEQRQASLILTPVCYAVLWRNWQS